MHKIGSKDKVLVLKTQNARFWKPFLDVTSVILKGYAENSCYSEPGFLDY